jgi:hypothetical protein
VSVSFAGFKVVEVNVREGKDSAVAHTEEDEEVTEFELAVGEPGEPVRAWLLRLFCRWSWRAFARAFSCVRTK